MMHILFQEGEFKDIEGVIPNLKIEVSSKELNLAEKIIGNMCEKFSEEMCTDKYRERLVEVIQQKIEGKSVVVAETKKPAKVVALMEALKRSLEPTSGKAKDASREKPRESPAKKRKQA